MVYQHVQLDLNLNKNKKNQKKERKEGEEETNVVFLVYLFQFDNKQQHHQKLTKLRRNKKK